MSSSSRTAARIARARPRSSSRAGRQARSASPISADDAGRVAVPGSRSDAHLHDPLPLQRLGGRVRRRGRRQPEGLGDEWEQSLGRLTATMSGPGRVLRAWGKPVWVRGDVRSPALARCCARSMSARVSSSSCERSIRGARSPRPRRCASRRRRARRDRRGGAGGRRGVRAGSRTDRQPRGNFLRTALIVLALAVVPALLVITAVFWLMGRERRTGYNREYEQEPPDRHRARAQSPRCSRPGGERRFV